MLKALRAELVSKRIDPDVALDSWQIVERARTESEMRAAMETFKATYPAVSATHALYVGLSVSTHLCRWLTTPRKRGSMRTSGLAGRLLADQLGYTWVWLLTMHWRA